MVLQPVPGERIHYGLVAQEVKEVLGDRDFGGWVKIDPTNPDSEEALRYDQFIAPLIAAVQELRRTVDEQAALIAQLQASKQDKPFRMN